MKINLTYVISKIQWTNRPGSIKHFIWTLLNTLDNGYRKSNGYTLVVVVAVVAIWKTKGIDIISKCKKYTEKWTSWTASKWWCV